MNTVQQFYGSIYKWMMVGVAISGCMVWVALNIPFFYALLSSPTIYVIMAVTFVMAIGMQVFIHKLSAGSAFMMYLLYAALNGIAMTGFLGYFIATNPMMVVGIFAAAALMFAALAILGYNTKYDMSGWGTFLFAGVWGIVVVSVINIFLGSDTLSFIISGVAILIFAALTVYDNQYYKRLFASLQDDESKSKAATIGALHMYINFIMMFQSLLNLSQLADSN